MSAQRSRIMFIDYYRGVRYSLARAAVRHFTFAALLGLLALSGVTTASAKELRIENFDAHIEVASNGSIDVTETIIDKAAYELGIEPAIAVDTHVFRVAHRLKLSGGKTPEQVEHDLTAIIPEPYLTRAHHWLILHGRYTCIARRPKCAVCVVADLCPSRDLYI